MPRTFVDLSHKLNSQISVYPGDPPFTCRPHITVENDGCAVKAITIGSHTGTHIDAPAHFIRNAKAIDQIPLSSLIGPALVVDLTYKKARERITWEEDLAPYAPRMNGETMLLLHTGWSAYWGTSKYYDHPYLDRGAAEHIIAAGVRLLGVDTLNPDETPYEGGRRRIGVRGSRRVIGCWGCHRRESYQSKGTAGCTRLYCKSDTTKYRGKRWISCPGFCLQRV